MLQNIGDSDRDVIKLEVSRCSEVEIEVDGWTKLEGSLKKIASLTINNVVGFYKK